MHEKRFPVVGGGELVITVGVVDNEWFDISRIVKTTNVSRMVYPVDRDLIPGRIKQTYAEAYEELKPDILKED